MTRQSSTLTPHWIGRYGPYEVSMASQLQSRPKRNIHRVNYKALSDLAADLQKGIKRRHSRSSTSSSSKSDLFPVTVVEQAGSRCKVHYVGYSSCYDEWKDCNELVAIDEP